MVVYYEDEDVKAEPSPKKVYMIINGEKVYIDILTKASLSVRFDKEA